MASKKLVINKADDDDLEICSPCFQIGPDVELKDVPMTGEEYLLHVINERKQYKPYTKSNVDTSKYAKNQTVFVETLTPVKAPPNGLKPTKEWQNIQVADFSDTRMYVSQIRSNEELWPETVHKINMEHTECHKWKSFFAQNSPTLTCVISLSAGSLTCGLEVLEKLIKKSGTIDQVTGQWVYSFLTCLHMPLLGETVSVLRDFARTCAEIRSKINIESESAIQDAAPLNVFISLVVIYFRQFDLADE